MKIYKTLKSNSAKNQFQVMVFVKKTQTDTYLIIGQHI